MLNLLITIALSLYLTPSINIPDTSKAILPEAIEATITEAPKAILTAAPEAIFTAAPKAILTEATEAILQEAPYINSNYSKDTSTDDKNTSTAGKLTTEKLRKAEETIGNPESDLYDEAAFCLVLQRALESDLINEADRQRAQYRLEMAAKNRPGATASDFRYQTREGETRSLLSTDSDNEKPILLLFYDPDCNHCMETITLLKDKDLSNLNVLAIYAEDDRDRWEETAGELPKDWTVGYALDPIQDEEIYVFITSPTIYLLKPDKTVILKDAKLSDIFK